VQLNENETDCVACGLKELVKDKEVVAD
jgi:Zn ribbon nucleic-acid-binding protein